MHEMLRRRFTRLLEEQARPPEERRRRFSYPPALIVVDGGRGQLTQATEVLAELGLSIPHIGLAKRLEEVYFPDRPDPLVIPRGSEALFVLQHIRDEAHRTAVAYHRTLREKRALHSPLDDIPGVGPSRKKALLKRFGSLDETPGRDASKSSPRRRASARGSRRRSTSSCTAGAATGG